MIPLFITDLGEVSDQTTLVDHVFAFYQGLMGSEGDPRAFSLSPHIWPEGKKISGAENLALELTFSPEKLHEVLFNVKQDLAPGPNGFNVLSFKRFWGSFKGHP
jgi:hypothetical protein